MFKVETALVQVWRVVDFCCQYLEREVSEDNYLYLQDLALLYSLERLDAFIDHFILTHFATLSFTPEFLHNIPLHKLCSYLSSGQVNPPGVLSAEIETELLSDLRAPLFIIRFSTTASRSFSRPPWSGSARLPSGRPMLDSSSPTSSSP